VTTAELAIAMDRANARLIRDGARERIVRLADGERLGGLVGPCWTLACGDCRGDVHDGPCPSAPAGAPPVSEKVTRRRRRA
jgi:hypothetical protein